MSEKSPIKKTLRALVGVLAVVFLVQLTFVDHLVWRGVDLGFPWTSLAFLALALFFLEIQGRVGAARWTGAALFWLCLFMYLSNFRWHGSDDLPTSLLPFSLLRDHTWTLDLFADRINGGAVGNLVRGAGGHWVSFYPVLGAILALPVYLIPVLRGATPDDHVIHQLEKMSAAVICAVAVLVLYRIYRRRTDARRAFLFALAYGLGTQIFSMFCQGLWQYGPSCLILLLSLWALDSADADPRWWAVCGFFAALSMGARSLNVFAWGGFALAVVLTGGKKGVWYFILGGLLPVCLLEAYWWGVVGTGLPAEFGVQQGLLHWPPSATAAAGLLISPARGLFLYSPVVFFCLLGAWSTLRGAPRRARLIAAALLLSTAARFLVFTCYGAWIGGYSYGSRYFIGGITMLFYFLPEGWSFAQSRRALKALWRPAFAASVLCHALGAYTSWRSEDEVTVHSAWAARAYPPICFAAKIFSRR